MIILICGTSSAGKTTVSKLLQNQLGDGWLRFSMDNYLEMLGDAFKAGLQPSNPELCKPNDVCYAKKHADESYEIIAGKYCSAVSSTIPNVLVLLAEKGFNIIVDVVIASESELDIYKKRLNIYGFSSVYLDVSSVEVTRREKVRGNRLPGSAVHWQKKLNFKDKCNVVINTNHQQPEQVTKAVINAFQID